ncbi:metallophosphoesterase family protein [Mucilaginibacter litoreus]|uniref:Metallophosphoesterase family protein n=1 Tax=Mucilaginibacter litoreus TaxID=1048221 RepID=A0ABW3AP30_9SPHI
MMKYNRPVIKLNQPDDRSKFKELPSPSGKYPYHLSLKDVLATPPAENRCVFLMVGDTGGLGRPEARRGIIELMAGQAVEGGFLYHLGDLVYHHGEAEQYAEQFFRPFDEFKGPVFAIAGNHDSDVNPFALMPYNSLDGFRAVFCDSIPRPVAFSDNSRRKSMIQPNIYWTLDTPLATFIGLHTNVPKYGVVTPEQQDWFEHELLNAPINKMLILCMHHAPYSADTNHGSSLRMINLINDVFENTKVRPDVVFSGHVHNYQRFTRRYEDGENLPFIIAGAGGFEELHSIAQTDDSRFAALETDNVHLEAFIDNQHGFLKITIERNDDHLNLNGDYYTAEGSANPADTFNITKPI